MTIPMADATQTTTSSSALALSSISTSVKYRGMIQESGYKKARNALFILFDYIATTSSEFYALHSFISYWRILQIMGPALAVPYLSFWGDGTIMNKVLDIVSISFHLIPGFARESCGVYVLFVYSILFIISFIAIGVGAFVLNQISKLPMVFSTILTLFFATLGYLLHPVAMEMAGELIGEMIVGKKEVSAVNIAALVLTAIAVLGFIWIYTNMYAVSITFKPDSLMTALPILETCIVIGNILITLIAAIASQLDRIPLIVMSFIPAILYIASIFIVMDKGGLVVYAHVKAVTASYFAGALFFVVLCIYEILEKQADEIVFVVLAVVWVLCYFVFSFIDNKKSLRAIRILDEVEENRENFTQLVKSPRALCDCIVTGFRDCHPICLNYDIFKLGLEEWPSHVELWLLFAKFTAIYPEETQQLSYISVGMIQNKLKGSLAKHTMQQISSTIKQREANLVPDLKVKLDKIGKQIQATKHKIRYIWDLVLQGNIKDLEHVIANAHKSIDICEAEFNHFLSQFPNNRFVARAYCRFLRDVLADHAAHKEWAQNVSLLQRGVNVKIDQAHILAIHAFPNLPRNTTNQLQSQATNPLGLTDDTLTQDIDVDDEQAAIDAEMRVSIRDSINNLTIPAYRMARILRIVTIVVLFAVPVIVMAVIIPKYIDDFQEPLDFMYDLSLLKTYLFQAVANVYYYVAEEINITTYKDPNNSSQGTIRIFPLLQLDENETNIGNPAVYLGDTWDTKNQTDYIIERITEYLPKLSQFSNFQPKNKDMDLVRQYLFDNHVTFTYLTNPTLPANYNVLSTNSADITVTTSQQNISVRDAISEYVINIREILSDDYQITNISMLNKSFTTNFNNLLEIDDETSAAIDVLRQFNIDDGQKRNKVIQMIMIIVIVVVVVLYVVLDVLIIQAAEREKFMIYHCLASLPKNVVSRVADSFKILKKDEDEEMRSTITRDEELNKQEENMLKIFSTSGDQSGHSRDDVYWIIFTILVAGLHAATTAIICTFLMRTDNNLMDAVPHIDFIMSAYSYQLITLLLTRMVTPASLPYVSFHIQGLDINRILSLIIDWRDRSIQKYQALRYGDSRLDAVPFQSLGIDISGDSVSHGCQETVPYQSHDIYKCWTPHLLFQFTEIEINGTIAKYTQTHYQPPGDDIHLMHMWHISQVHVFDQYFASMFTKLIPMVLSSLRNDVPVIIGSSFALLILAIIIEIAFLITINNSEERQKFALRLLLHCPGNVVASNTHIAAILAGHFTSKNVDSTTRDAEFYEILVKELPDSVIICDINGNIVSANKATAMVYGKSSEDLIGKTIDEIGSIYGDQNPFPSYLSSQEKASQCKQLSFTGESGVATHVEVLISVMKEESIIVTTRDITQTVMYNKLISDERQKSDQLLSSILPAKLVPRVQAGEKNISFAVQSATILFMDIVSFTPWCGSLPAATVMSTLNRLFKDFDALVATHPTMTKIKCIGDCYMAAGGIFAEINQPAQHAKDVVDFGLCAIEALEKIDVEIDQNLQIRVGINTGGPIVAGVLGTEKPTFEILGPTINMAQQMEHHGVPMKVHVSRAVYELIYGGNFVVKERGEIEIKGGKVVTYLVERAKET